VIYRGNPSADQTGPRRSYLNEVPKKSGPPAGLNNRGTYATGNESGRKALRQGNRPTPSTPPHYRARECKMQGDPPGKFHDRDHRSRSQQPQGPPTKRKTPEAGQESRRLDSRPTGGLYRGINLPLTPKGVNHLRRRRRFRKRPLLSRGGSRLLRALFFRFRATVFPPFHSQRHALRV